MTFSPWAASQPQKAGPSTAGAVTVNPSRTGTRVTSLPQRSRISPARPVRHRRHTVVCSRRSGPKGAASHWLRSASGPWAGTSVTST